MLGSVWLPSTYGHSHPVYWLYFYSLYVLHNMHAYFYPLSQMFLQLLYVDKEIHILLLLTFRCSFIFSFIQLVIAFIRTSVVVLSAVLIS
jgi:hypothetical protein